MKSIINYTLFSITILICSCTKNFDSINTDPTHLTGSQYDPNYLFTAGELGCANVTEYQMYNFSCATQILASTWNYYGGGDKYDKNIYSSNDRFFTEGYTYIGYLYSAIDLAKQKDSAAYNNIIQMSRIMSVLQFQRITDIYGDVPYSQVGMGQQGIVYPQYDEQSSIYPAMLATLHDAINKLDPSKPLATGDLLYGGSISQWKKFGYSLMLRVAMRLVKADAATAQKYAEEAAGNTFTSVQDDAVVKMDGQQPLSTNKTANLINRTDFAQIRWSNTFINYLTGINDPRRFYIAEKSDTGLAFNNDISHPGISYSAGSSIIGMPNGYLLDQSQTASYIANAPGYPGPTGTGSNAFELGNYARPVMSVFGRNNLSEIMLSYAQTEFLLTEAKVRGWNVGSTSSSQHFSNGVAASLQMLSEWDASFTIPQSDIANFVNSFPLDLSSQNNSLNQINSQYWVTSAFDFIEAWSNWKRTGFPNLTPVDYPYNVTNGTIPRRLTYPSTERGLNNANYQSAINRLGGVDLPTLRVWWDK